MRTIPNTYKSGSEWKYPQVHLVKMNWVSGSATGSIYLSTMHTGSMTYLYNNDTASMETKYLPYKIMNEEGEQNVDAIAEIEHGFDLSRIGGVSNESELTFSVLNHNDFISTYHYNFENQVVEVWEGYQPPTGSVEITTDFICNFKGALKESPKYDYSFARFSAVDYRNIISRQIPTQKAVSEDHFGINELSEGKYYNLVFGDFYYNQGESHKKKDFYPLLEVDSQFKEFVAAEHDLVTNVWSVYFVNDAGLQGTVSSPTTRSFMANENTYNVWLTEVTVSSANRGGRVTNRQSGYTNEGIYCIFELYPSTNGFFTERSADLAFAQTWMNGCDDDTSTSNWTEISGTGDYEAFWGFDKLDNPGNFISNQSPLSAGWPGSPVDMYVYYLNTDLYRTGNWQMRVRNKADNSLWTGGNIVDGLGTEGFNFGLSASQGGWDWIWDCEVGLYSSNAPDRIRIYDVYAKVRSHIGNYGTAPRTNRPVESKVRTFGNTRNIRGTAIPWEKPSAAPKSDWNTNIYATSYGAPMLEVQCVAPRNGNGFTYGDPIETPAMAIEWMLREKLGLSDDIIVTSSFDAVDNKTNGTRKGWKLATVIKDRADAFEHIGYICEEFGLMCNITQEGKIKLISMDSSSAVFTIDSASMLAYSDGRPIIEVGSTSVDDIRNDFIGHYRFDYSKNEPQEILYLADINNDGTYGTNFLNQSITLTGSLSGSSYTGSAMLSSEYYGADKLYEAEFYSIRNHNTAETALKKIMDWKLFKRLTVSTTVTKTTSSMALECGDICKINALPLPSYHINSSPFMITRIKYPVINSEMSSYVELELEEVPNPNTGRL